MPSLLQKTLLIITYFALLLPLGYQSLGLYFNNDDWLATTHPIQKAEDYLNDEFAPGEDLLVGVSLEKPFFDETTLNQLRQLSEQIELLPGVREIKSPLEATTILRAEESMQVVSFGDALDKKYIPNLENYKKRLTESVYYGRLIAKDYRSFAIIVNLEKKTGAHRVQYQLRDDTTKAVAGLIGNYPRFADWRFSGESWLNLQLDKKSESNLGVFMPLLSALIVILLGVLFRSWVRSIIILSSAVLALLFCTAVMVTMGHPLTTIGLSLPVLILVIAIADSIHIVTHWDRLAELNQRPLDLLRATVKHTWLPCLFTSLTSAIGFGAFFSSDLLPLSRLGTDATLAIVGVYAIIVATNWCALYCFVLPTAKKTASANWLSIFAEKCVHLSIYYPKQIVLTTLLLATVSVASLSTIYFETNLLEVFFKKSSPTYKGFEYIDQHLGGSGSLDLIFQTEEAQEFKQTKKLYGLYEIEKTLLKDPFIQSIQSYREPVGLMYRRLLDDPAAILPKSEEELAQTILFLEFSRGASKKDVLSPYVDFTYQNARMHLQTPNLTSTQTAEMKARVSEQLGDWKPAQITWSGSNSYFQALSQLVLDAQLSSLLITLGIIYVFFLLLFGLKLGTLGMIPNVVPILITGGAITLLRIPFDFATVLIASISFGLCVDDTIHFVYRYRTFSRNPEVSTNHAIERTLHSLASPLVFTTILFCFGFGVFLASELVVLFRFGAFSLVAIVSALFANMLLLPACLKLMADLKFPNTANASQSSVA